MNSFKRNLKRNVEILGTANVQGKDLWAMTGFEPMNLISIYWNHTFSIDWNQRRIYVKWDLLKENVEENRFRGIHFLWMSNASPWSKGKCWFFFLKFILLSVWCLPGLDMLPILGTFWKRFHSVGNCILILW